MKSASKYIQTEYKIHISLELFTQDTASPQPSMASRDAKSVTLRLTLALHTGQLFPPR
jgi:hypothetical protein